MAKIPVGLQLFSVRRTMDLDYLGTLQKVADIGYKNIEFAIFPYNNGDFEPEYGGAELKKILADMGMRVVNTMVAFHPKLNWDQIIDYCAELGSEGFCCPIWFYKNKDDVLHTAEWLNNMGRKGREQGGLEHYFHNHFQEFQKFDGKYAYNYLLENTDPEYVRFEIDTYWAQRGGADPIELMEQTGKRLRLLHQKDISHTAKPVNLLDVVPQGRMITYDVFYPLAQYNTDYTEVGRGIMDVVGIVRKALEIGTVSNIVIEQDQTSLTELESVKIGFDCLHEIMDRIEKE